MSEKAALSQAPPSVKSDAPPTRQKKNNQLNAFSSPFLEGNAFVGPPTEDPSTPFEHSPAIFQDFSQIPINPAPSFPADLKPTGTIQLQATGKMQSEMSEDYQGELLQENFTSGVPPTQIQGNERASAKYTGMPTSLKAGLEALSGMDFSGVRVYANSFKPAQFDALAYTQGDNIYLSPGQEKNLPHEGWHVVQQRQGRVKQTIQAKGVAINDNKGLEREADVMGTKALQTKRADQATMGSAEKGVKTKSKSGISGKEIEASREKESFIIQRKGKGLSKNTAVLVTATTFEEAAKVSSDMLKSIGWMKPARIVIVNGPNLRVFDDKGTSLSNKTFHLQVPGVLPPGVWTTDKSRFLKGIHIVNGRVIIGGLTGGEKIDFAKDIDDKKKVDELTKGFRTFYVSPISTSQSEQADAPQPTSDEKLPEFMQFEAKTKANLPAWPSAVIPLTPQLATVNSMGSFKCMVKKNQGSSTIDRVTNLMESTSFHWQVLKLDSKLKPTKTKTASRWETVKEGYHRRLRDLEADKKTLKGDPKKQSVPEKVFRAAVADQVNNARTILAMTGQTVMTAVSSVVGSSNQLSTEDIKDVPFKEQGDFFVRCLATQSGGRRATSVAGVMVSVFDIEDVARDALPTAESLTQKAEDNAANVEEKIKEIDANLKAGKGDPVALKLDRAHLVFRLDLFKAVGKAGTDPHAKKVAMLTAVKAQIAYLNSAEFPSDAKYKIFKTKSLKNLKQKEKELSAEVGRMEKKLKDWNADIIQIGYMPAVLVDSHTGGRMELSFAVGERSYIAADNLKVVIADVTSKKGKIFSGKGSGSQGAGRQDAWLTAMDDMRKNLGRGRGYLAYEVPSPYATYKSMLPNPMQLQMGIGSQLKEMVDDTAQVMTLAAIMAAPFTGGASLGILAVLAPVGVASSLYNVVNRAMYGDLELDNEAVFDFVDIATAGLGKVSQAGKLASRSMRIVATSSKVAIGLLEGGQYILISYNTYTELMKEEDPNGDPRESRRRKLLALLNLFQAASIPVSQKLWGQAQPIGPTKKTPSAAEGGSKPLDGSPSPRSKETVPPKTSPETKVPKEGTRPTSKGQAEVPVLSKRQRKAIPKHLQPEVVVKEGRDAKVHYEMDPRSGLIKNVVLHVGRKASVSDIQAHVQVADLMLKYKGLGGRLRRLRDQFVGLFMRRDEMNPDLGSRAWEAGLELIKLDRMMKQRHQELASYAKNVSKARDLAREAQLRDDLDILQSQYNEHSAVLSAIELGGQQGRGYVAVEGLSRGEQVRQERGYPEARQGYHWRFRKGQLEIVAFEKGKPKLRYDEAKGDFVPETGPQPSPRFDAGIDRRKAFRELGGYDPNTSFGKFVKVLMDLGVITSREDVIKAMQEPGNLTHRTVRGNVKEGFKTQLVDLITSRSYLKKTARYKEVLKASGSHKQAYRAAATEILTQVSKRLGSEGRGSLGERVYQEVFGRAKDWQQVEVSKEALAKAKGVDVSKIDQPRVIDRMEGNTGREIKNVTGPLGAREKGQIDDMIAMLGSDISYQGRTRNLKKAVVTFQDPVGGKANASLAHEFLSQNQKANLTFEFHTREGRVIKVTSKNRDILLKDDFATRLGVGGKK